MPPPSSHICDPQRCEPVLQDANWKQVSGTRGSKFVLIPPCGNPALPALDAVILVEGSADAAVVRRAVNAPVLSIGGVNQGYDKATIQRIHAIAALTPQLIVLADPDAFGRVYRNHLDVLLSGSALHAFLPVPCAVSTGATKHHAACNVGVEHAHPADVAKALARPHHSTYSAHAHDAAAPFTAEQLQAWGLTKPFENQNDPSAPKDVATRRELLCNALGVARSDGKQLLRALNGYGFNPEQVRPLFLFLSFFLFSAAALASLRGAQRQPFQRWGLAVQRGDTVCLAILTQLGPSLDRTSGVSAGQRCRL